MGVCFSCADAESIIADGTDMYDQTPKGKDVPATTSLDKLAFLIEKGWRKVGVGAALVLLTIGCHAQSFTITPDPATKIKGVSGWSGSSVTYNPYDRSFSAKDGLYIPDAYNVVGGFYVEAQIWITGTKGELFTKAGTCSYGVDYQKLLCNYAPTGSDKCYGLGKIPLNKWVTVGFGVDTVGRTVFKIDSIPDLTRNMVFSGPMPQTTNTKYTFFNGFTGLRCRRIRFWTGKPPISATGFDCSARMDKDTLRLNFTRIDRGQLGTKLTILQEDPKGITRTRIETVLKPGLFKLPYKDSLNGSWTFQIKTAKHHVKKTCFKGPSPTFPDKFTIGMYSVLPTDMRKAVGIGVNAFQSDYCVINQDQNWKAIGKYLDTAKKLGAGTVMVMGTQSSKGNIQFADSIGERSLMAFYSTDEAQGDLEGLERNFWTCTSLYPSVPVIANANNFSRLEELAEMSHVRWINVYGSGRQVYDQTIRASKYGPVWVSLPQYPAYEYDFDTLQNMAAQAVVAGASGIFWFCLDDRKKQDQSRWYIPRDCPKCWENIARINKWLKDMPIDWSPIPTVNPNIVACRKGGRSIYVNLTDKVQMEGDVQFGSLDVREF